MTSSESVLRAVLETLAGPSIVWAPDGRMVFGSRQFFEVFGIGRDDIETATETGLEQAFSRRGVTSLPGSSTPTYETPTGQHFQRQTQLLAGGIKLDLFRDITGDRLAAHRREELLGMAIHDLRSPLANVRSYAGLLLTRAYELDARVRRSAEVIARNADRALRLLQLYFDGLRADTGELALECQPVPLLSALNEAFSSRRATAAEKGVEIPAAFPPALPVVVGDRERLVNAIGAFVDNAIARSPADGRVGLLLEERPSKIWLGFTDSGPALDPTEAKLVFDRESQVLKERRLGTGFAIAVARSIAEMHGGSVEVTSEPGHTVFAMLLPR